MTGQGEKKVKLNNKLCFVFTVFVHKAALPEVQEQYQGLLKEKKVLQQQEHALQEESLSVRLRIEQIETTITEHNNKIKHWQKEVGEEVWGLCVKSSTLLVLFLELCGVFTW